jgi:hypothetical protein
MQTQTQREARVEKLAIDLGLAEGVGVNIVATERAPREVAQRALELGASAIIMVHVNA